MIETILTKIMLTLFQDKLVYLAVVSAAAFYVLWVLFVAAMYGKRIRKERGGLSWQLWAMFGPMLLVAGVIDVVLNWTVGLTLGVSKHLTLSGKMCALRKENKGGWRQKVATFICEHWLNPFDPDHC